MLISPVGAAVVGGVVAAGLFAATAVPKVRFYQERIVKGDAVMGVIRKVVLAGNHARARAMLLSASPAVLADAASQLLTGNILFANPDAIRLQAKYLSRESKKVLTDLRHASGAEAAATVLATLIPVALMWTKSIRTNPTAKAVAFGTWGVLCLARIVVNALEAKTKQELQNVPAHLDVLAEAIIQTQPRAVTN